MTPPAGAPGCQDANLMSPRWTCAQINEFYGNADNVPDGVGFCIDTDEWGTWPPPMM